MHKLKLDRFIMSKYVYFNGQCMYLINRNCCHISTLD